jgi:hypothetical protein
MIINDFFLFHHLFTQATKQHIFSYRLSRHNQPNRGQLHGNSLAPGSLAPWYEPGSVET